jgi:hypothetical protein
MSLPEPSFDVAAAHRYFAVEAFNFTWLLIDKHRSPDENEKMILTAMASLWHWTQRDDCTPQNLSVGHWQVARVYALVGQGENAWSHAERALHFAAGSPPFYVGYAHEALARAAAVLRDQAASAENLALARACAAQVADADERRTLEHDLKTIG